MHDTWKEDVEDRDKLYAKEKKKTERLLSDATEAILSCNVGGVITSLNTIDSVGNRAAGGEDIRKIFAEQSEATLHQIMGWAIIGSRHIFVRCVETAMMNEQLEDA